MGQYHSIYNKTKKEFLHPHRLNSGAKLLEQVGWDMSPSTALFLLLANSNGGGGGDARHHEYIGRWAGDEIVVQGDYADARCPSYLSRQELEEYQDISTAVREMLIVALN